MKLDLERYPRTVHLSDGSAATLRPLREDDTEKLIALFQDVRPEDLSVMRDNVTDPEVIRGWTTHINHARTLPIVAEVDDAIVGEVSLHRNPNTPHATIGQFRMYVREDFRGRGLGGQLVEDVIELARDVDLEQLLVEMFVESAAMIATFERRGFEREAILPIYQMVVLRYNLGPRPDRDALGIRHADALPPRRLWPDLVFDAQMLEVPDELNLCEVLLDHHVARGWGRRPAIYYRNEIVTYELLLSEVKRLAGALERLGVRAGDPVWLHLPNTPQAIAANFAVQRLGAVSVPTPPQFSPRELSLVASESGAVGVITTAELLPEVQGVRDASAGPLRSGFILAHGLGETQTDARLFSYARLVARAESGTAPARRNRREIGLLLYTSADSGHPRGTAHRLDGLLSVLDTFGAKVWRINEEDIIASLAPLGFAQGFVTNGLMPFRFGAGVALPDDPLADSGPAVAHTVRQHRVSILFAPPTAYRQILGDATIDETDLASLRLCSTGGEPLTAETFGAWEKRFVQPIFEGFGTTEMLYAFLSNAVGMKPRPGSLGRVVPGYEVKVVNDFGNELGTGEIGFLNVRGPTGTLYWNNPDAQRRAIHNGWNRPSDYGYMDGDGYFWFVARSDDLIKTRSYRIDPNEVESVIRAHPRVKDVAVIGLPDEMRGQRPVAYVVPTEMAEADLLLARGMIANLKGMLADYKVPDEVIFVDRLPRDAHGNLQRRLLRDQMRRQGKE